MKLADERYYNRGQTEDMLDKEARHFVSSFWGTQYSPDVKPVPGLSEFDMFRV